MDKEPKRILVVLFSIILLFLSLIIYLTWFQVFQSKDIKQNAYNKRLWINEEKILRGTIFDRNNNVLAYNEKTEESSKRIYNYGNLYSHIIGYSYREYGKTGLELKYNRELLGISESSTLNQIKEMVIDEKKGNSLRLTIDHGLQEKSRELIKGRKGAIVVMNPRTGEVYSMVSSPDYNAAKLRDEWKNISVSEESPLVNRATQGLYEPGSSFKILTAASILENGLDTDYTCQGSVVIDGYEFKDYNKTKHGKIDLKAALTKSCNSYFVKKADELGKDKLGETADRFMINKEIPFDLPIEKSRFNYKEKLSKTEIAASGIGQGKVLLTPLNMALITSAIANDGIMMDPLLVKEIIDPEGEKLSNLSSRELSKSMSSSYANELTQMMVNVVNNGTGKNAQITGVSVAGKTGTAENQSGKNHAWFTGFGPAENPQVVVTVLLESDGGFGGSESAPIARELINYTLKNIKN